LGLQDEHGLKRFASFIELYVASPGYKALAKSTTSDLLADTYASDTVEHAKERAVAECQRRHAGHTCRVIDPPENRGDK
jgi:hypothetical protein